MSVLVLIPARGGSKRLPGKNLRTVGGVSLVGHAVRCGLEFVDEAEFVEATVMCDTDSEAIAEEAKRYGAWVPFLREPEYALDGTSSAESVIRTLQRLGTDDFTTLVLLQPTSPLRSVRDVVECWSEYDYDWRTMTVAHATGRENGAVYVTSVYELRASLSFQWRAHPVGMATRRSIDINTAEDLAEAERLWSLQHG